MGGRFRRLPFWERVRLQTVEGPDGCHLFVGRTNEDGYARVGMCGKLVFLHRVMWERHNGPVPTGKEICHTCDVRSCVNPDHLFAASHLENIRDMWRKGRGRVFRGSDQAQAKLSEADIPTIRTRIANGDTCAAIAADYQVSDAAIRNVKKFRGWSHA